MTTIILICLTNIAEDDKYDKEDDNDELDENEEVLGAQLTSKSEGINPSISDVKSAKKNNSGNNSNIGQTNKNNNGQNSNQSLKKGD